MNFSVGQATLKGEVNLHNLQYNAFFGTDARRAGDVREDAPRRCLPLFQLSHCNDTVISRALSVVWTFVWARESSQKSWRSGDKQCHNAPPCISPCPRTCALLISRPNFPELTPAPYHGACSPFATATKARQRPNSSSLAYGPLSKSVCRAVSRPCGKEQVGLSATSTVLCRLCCGKTFYTCKCLSVLLKKRVAFCGYGLEGPRSPWTRCCWSMCLQSVYCCHFLAAGCVAGVSSIGYCCVAGTLFVNFRRLHTSSRRHVINSRWDRRLLRLAVGETMRCANWPQVPVVWDHRLTTSNLLWLSCRAFDLRRKGPERTH